MAQIYQGNGSGSPGNVSWGPGYMPGISVNAELSLRATKHTTVKVVKIICLLHQVCFPDIQGNSSPFLHMFPGRFFWFKGNSSSPKTPRIREQLTFCELINHAGSWSVMTGPHLVTFAAKKCTVIRYLPIYTLSS